jgi:hypothetical protein
MILGIQYNHTLVYGTPDLDIWDATYHQNNKSYAISFMA